MAEPDATAAVAALRTVTDADLWEPSYHDRTLELLHARDVVCDALEQAQRGGRTSASRAGRDEMQDRQIDKRRFRA